MNECSCGQSTNPNGLCDGFGDNICREIIHENESHRQGFLLQNKIWLYNLVNIQMARYPVRQKQLGVLFWNSRILSPFFTIINNLNKWNIIF